MAATSVANLKKNTEVETDIFALFEEAGFEEISPSIIQPAEIYLDQVGEVLRGRTYVFTDIEGTELCLRPDLTVPAGRIFISQIEDNGRQARYCYRGPAFRYPPRHDHSIYNPREFHQLGIEVFGDKTPVKTEVEVLSLIYNGLHKVGLGNFELRLGDLSLFEGFLEALDLPDHWRERLKDCFWRPAAFQNMLKSLRDPTNIDVPAKIKELLLDLPSDNFKGAMKQVSKYLDDNQIPIIGARSLEEITKSLVEQAVNMRLPAIDAGLVDLIERYLSISAPPRAASACLGDMAETENLNLDRHLAQFNKRLDQMEEAGISLGSAIFTAEFGRNMEYYTGFVFQFEVPGRGKVGHVAGGGRYDGLVQSLSDGISATSVGGAIHMERLLYALTGIAIDDEMADEGASA